VGMDGGEAARQWSAERGHIPAPEGSDRRPQDERGGHERCPDGTRPPCCPLYHEAIELIGRRWTGAIVSVLIQRTTLRFGEIAESVPELSDRLLSERMKELEARGVVTRTVRPGRPVRVEYELTEMGRALEPAVQELERWARQWLARR
jgi:DNA-binding HxlR family transcriptional regulator